MVELREIHAGALGGLISLAFKDDWQLINIYHLVNGDFAACVKSTFKEIDKVAQDISLNYWGIYSDDKVIGFTVTGHKILLSFGINIAYRSKEIVLAWWECVKTLLGSEFVTWLFKKNTRTIEFVKRNGMEIWEDMGDYYSLIYCALPSE